MKQLQFVIHHHFSKQEHFDFRFQTGDHLESYALPKGMPVNTEKHLAIYVGERPLSALTFEGEIEEGHYGAGKIIIWDSGIFEQIERDDYKIVFTLQGKKVIGEYVMIRFKDSKDNWLLFKKKV